MKHKPPRYELDDHTRELLSEALEWAQSTSHVQIDDTAAEYINGVVVELCERFGIEITHTQIQVGKDSDTGETVTILREVKPPPRFTVIEGLKGLEEQPPPTDEA